MKLSVELTSAEAALLLRIAEAEKRQLAKQAEYLLSDALRRLADEYEEPA